MTTDRPAGVRFALRDWLRPPRPHGETIEGRVVSPLELFYDLVFVVFVSQVAHQLAAHPDGVGVRNFAVLFGLLWYAWVNGTLYHDLHGGDDGRSRLYMFVQMSMVAMISVYAGHAGDDATEGRIFSILFLTLIAWLTYQWWVVRRQDDADMAATSTPYFVGLAGLFLFVLASVFTTDGLRVLLWALGTATAILAPSVRLARGRTRGRMAFSVSASMAERFGLLTIIVLGEVMVGIVNGLSQAEHSVGTTVTGLLCLGIGFGIWWNYFDFVGLRPPRPGFAPRNVWMVTHLPLSMAVAATGAGTVSLIEHSAQRHTPTGTAWLIGGSVAALCLSLATLLRVLPERAGARLVPHSLVVAALVAVGAAAVRPRPWILTLVLVLVLTAVWVESFARHARLGEPFVDAADHAH